MSRQKRLGMAVLAAVALAVLAVGFYDYRQFSEPQVCGFCQRPLKPNLRIVAEVGGRRVEACCVRCAISEAAQEKKPLRVLQVRDYTTGATLRPEDAYYVDDSRAMACDHDMMRMNEMKHSEQMAFDRCSPGTFAFARQADAEAFVQANGGVIRRFAQILQGVPQ